MMITYTQEELSSIVHAFAFPGTITDWTPHGNGHINDTFLVRSTENGVLRNAQSASPPAPSAPSPRWS